MAGEFITDIVSRMTPPEGQFAAVGQALKQAMAAHVGLAEENRGRDWQSQVAQYNAKKAMELKMMEEGYTKPQFGPASTIPEIDTSQYGISETEKANIGKSLAETASTPVPRSGFGNIQNFIEGLTGQPITETFKTTPKIQGAERTALEEKIKPGYMSPAQKKVYDAAVAKRATEVANIPEIMKMIPTTPQEQIAKKVGAASLYSTAVKQNEKKIVILGWLNPKNKKITLDPKDTTSKPPKTRAEAENMIRMYEEVEPTTDPDIVAMLNERYGGSTATYTPQQAQSKKAELDALFQ